MRRTSGPHAKVARPILRGAVPRKRLFALLDRHRDQRVIWVCGPAGSGKTTLVGSYLEAQKRPCLWYQVDADDKDPATFFYYLGLAAQQAAPRFRKPLPLLTPEYLPGLAAFAGRYFESLCERLKAPAALVFDNLHEADGDAGLFELVHHALSHMPPGRTAFLISRHEPPPAFARMLANREMGVVGWDALRLTSREAAAIIRLRAADIPSRKSLLDVRRAADGWAAGLVLLLEWATRPGAELQALRRGTPDQILDYFGNEVFRKTDPATQEFLLKTALLPRMTAKTAEALTGLPSAGTILARLSSRHAFTEKRFHAEPVYQYHALFREFLLARGLQVVPPEALMALRRQAATLLEADDEPEAAAALLAEVSDWEGLAALIMKHAPSLLAQGRHRALDGWLNHLPTAVSASTPWLQYWKGACMLPLGPSAARPFFERAFGAFKARGDATGTFLAWTGAVDSSLYGFADLASLDRWIAEMDALSCTLGEFPSPEIEARVAASMVLAIAFRQPWRPDLETWASRGLATQAPDAAGARLQICWTVSYHALMMGDVGKAALALDRFRQMARSPGYPTLVRLNSILMEASYHHHAMGAHEATLNLIAEGLALARREGIHILDHQLQAQGAASALDGNDWREARRWLEQMESSVPAMPPFDAANYHHQRAREALIRGDARAALPHSDRAVQAILACGAALQVALLVVLRARVLHALGRDAEAAKCLAQAYANAKLTSSREGQFFALILDAEMSLDRGREAHGLEVLRRALRLGNEGGYLNSFVDVPAATATLCARALEAGIEVPYVQWLIRKRHLVLEEPPYQLESWPWALKAYTLGDFRLEREDGPVSLSRKGQPKPLLLLKALIAFGGQEVREEQLSDALWPEAEGDAAHSAFTTTLSRLRELLGDEQAIRVQDGRVTLDARTCWVDTWAFERLLGDALNRLKAGRPEPDRGDAKRPELSLLVGKGLALYRGHFLPGDEAHPWTTSHRERLQERFLRLIGRWGEHLERMGQWTDAVEIYQRGLDVDELAETLYQRLMGCYQQLGLRAEAMATYRRCRQVLSSALGIDPSPKTEALHRALRGQDQ